MKRVILLLLICSLVTFSSAWAETPGTFTDVAGQWWEQPIAECNATSIMVGRAPGIFAPKASVTRLEAIILLNRALGYRNQADTYAMSQGNYNFPAGFPEWGKKNVAFAADRGFISKAGIPSMQPNHPASRAEIAVLFANALKLSADGYQLNFADNNAIPANLQTFVAAAVKHGVMVGKTGNKFDPNANVTRGEMAVIIARLFENGKISPQADRYFIARANSIDSSNKRVTLLRDGQAVTYSLATNSVFYREGKKGLITAFKANENIKVVLDSANRVLYLAHTVASPTSTVATQSTLTGTIRGLLPGSPVMLSFQPDNGVQANYPLQSTLSITQNGISKDLTSLTNGAKAEIKLNDGNVIEIKLLYTSSGNEIKGYIVNVYIDHISIQYDNGTSEKLNVSAASQLRYITTGQRVAITKIGSTLNSINVLNEPRKFFGETLGINSADITIRDIDDRERTIEFVSGVKLKDKDGRTIDLSDIKVNDNVEIEINAQNKAVIITKSRVSTSNLEGEITYLRKSGNLRISISPESSSERTFNVSPDVTVYKGSSKKTFNFLSEGDFVKLRVNSSNEVTRIDILENKIIEGKVTYIRTTGTWKIRVLQSDATENTYTVEDDADIYKGTTRRNFDRISKGDFVKLTLDSDSEVVRIDILDYQRVEGEVTYIKTSGTRSIKIENTDGDELSYGIASDVKVWRGSTERNLDYISEGDQVELKINSSNKVFEIRIL